MSHYEYNKWCDGRVRGKTRDAQHLIANFKREVINFGSVLTRDPTSMWDAEKGPGIGEYKYAFCVQSLFGHKFC